MKKRKKKEPKSIIRIDKDLYDGLMNFCKDYQVNLVDFVEHAIVFSVDFHCQVADLEETHRLSHLATDGHEPDHSIHDHEFSSLSPTKH